MIRVALRAIAGAALLACPGCGLIPLLGTAAGGSGATLALQWALAPNPVVETSVKVVCAGYAFWKLEHPAGTEPKWEAVLDSTCAKDPDSVAAAGADLLEAALMLELKLKGPAGRIAA